MDYKVLHSAGFPSKMFFSILFFKLRAFDLLELRGWLLIVNVGLILRERPIILPLLISRRERRILRLLPRINLSHVGGLPFTLNAPNDILHLIKNNLSRQIIVLTHITNLRITSTESTRKTHHFTRKKHLLFVFINFLRLKRSPLQQTLHS